MTPIIVVAGLTLLASFLCSLFEAALYAITPAQIEVLRAEGKRGAEQLAKLRENIERPIAAILTVNTIAHTVGAAWCGAMVGELYGSAAVGVFAAVFTLLVLALTEIVPKSLGVRFAPLLGTHVVWPISLMIWSVWPIVWLAERAMHLLMGPSVDSGPSEDELVIVAGLAARGGNVRREERRWVENALRLDKVTAGDLRTPRTVVETLRADRSVAELVAHPELVNHSRVPVTESDNPDELLGYVFRRELYDVALSRPGEEVPLRSLLHPLRFVPESMPAHELLNLFLEDRAHIVAVLDEYGGFEGVVSLEDVLECLLGKKIVDEHDEIEDMQEHALEKGASLDRTGSSEDVAGGASRPNADGIVEV